MHYLSVAAMFKQENSWLDEWIRYHRGVGVEYFYLFSHDDNPTVSDRILQPYVEEGMVETIHIARHDTLAGIPRSDIQTYMLREAVRLAEGKTVWLALIDLDEFILPRQDDDLPATLSEFEETATLAVNWQIFGTSGNIRRPSTQIDHLLHRANDGYWFNQYVKSIVRPERVALEKIVKYANYSLPHMLPLREGIIVDERFERIDRIGYRKPFCAEKLAVNHYALRSFQDFWEIKAPRGRFYGQNDCTNKYWDNYDRNDVFDDEISRRFGHLIR